MQQPAVARMLKALETRGLVKSVRSVANGSRKVYMLRGLEPAREVTGGAWYTGHEFDSAFTVRSLLKTFFFFALSRPPSHFFGFSFTKKNSTNQVALAGAAAALVRRAGPTRGASAAEVARQLAAAGLARVALREDDVRTVLDALVCDGVAERVLRKPSKNSSVPVLVSEEGLRADRERKRMREEEEEEEEEEEAEEEGAPARRGGGASAAAARGRRGGRGSAASAAAAPLSSGSDSSDSESSEDEEDRAFIDDDGAESDSDEEEEEKRENGKGGKTKKQRSKRPPKEQRRRVVDDDDGENKEKTEQEQRQQQHEQQQEPPVWVYIEDRAAARLRARGRAPPPPPPPMSSSSSAAENGGGGANTAAATTAAANSALAASSAVGGPGQALGALAGLPCGKCPVSRECADGGAVGPQTCAYLSRFLDF